jgi:hypothetical protein
MLGEPQSQFGNYEEEGKFFLPTGIEPQFHSYAAHIPVTINKKLNSMA